MEFRRTLSNREAEQWLELVNTIKDIEITEGAHEVKWALEKSGQFTTKSVYRMIAHRGVSNYRMRKTWECKLPLKLKIFLWLIMQDRLQTGITLRRRRWKGSHKCIICNSPETIDHIFFSHALLQDSHGNVWKKLWDGAEHRQVCKIS